MSKIYDLLAIAEQATALTKSSRETWQRLPDSIAQTGRFIGIANDASECALRCLKSAEIIAASIELKEK